jgi:3-isopropylmalate/(R)-2-methylmalate dehydratase small subunit
MRGRAFVFGDEINTDLITPGEYMGHPIEEIADHVFEPIRPSFVEEFEPGDVVVAGEHFGSGSSREIAPAAIKEADVSVVVAESFSRIFYRNAIAIGLPITTAPAATEAIEDGDDIEVDIEAGLIRNHTRGTTLDCEELGESVREIVEAGGLIEHARSQSRELATDIKSEDGS